MAQLITNDLLLITVCYQGEKLILHELCSIVTKTGCNLQECRMKLMGSFELIALVAEGSWDVLAKAETLLGQYGKRHEIEITLKRTSYFQLKYPSLPYYIQVIALDRPGIVSEVTQFFNQEHVVMSEIDTTVQRSPHTGSNIFSMTMAIFVPEQTSIAELRERFIIFCDANNFDAMIEPMK